VIKRSLFVLFLTLLFAAPFLYASSPDGGFRRLRNGVRSVRSEFRSGSLDAALAGRVSSAAALDRFRGDGCISGCLLGVLPGFHYWRRSCAFLYRLPLPISQLIRPARRLCPDTRIHPHAHHTLCCHRFDRAANLSKKGNVMKPTRAIGIRALQRLPAECSHTGSSAPPYAGTRSKASAESSSSKPQDR